MPAEIQFESESNDAFSVEDPGSVSVPANSNETFEKKLKSIYSLYKTYIFLRLFQS